MDTAGRTTDSVLSDLYYQIDVIYSNICALPEYTPGTTVPCYNITSSGTTIYLYFG